MVLDPTTLRTVAAVMRTGSFAGAGRELGYTASAVSQQMSGLERTLGLQLFEREARRVRPTEAAIYLHERADQFLGMLSQVEADLTRMAAGQAGRVRIGSFPSAGPAILAQAIARFLVRRREVEISLDEGEPHELFPRVVRGDLDVALGFRYDLVPVTWPDEIHVIELMTEDLHVIAHERHRLASKREVRLRELAAERWIANREETSAHTCLLTLGAKHDFVPHIAFRSNSFGTVRGLVGAGLGVAMVPSLAYVPDDNIVALPIQDQLPRRQIVAVIRRVDTNPLTEALVDSMRQVARTLSPRAESG